MEKYELTDATIDWHGYTLRRIKACKYFVTIGGKEIHAGDLGGYVEKEANLSQNGNAWISGNARACGASVVYGNAEVRGSAYVCGEAEVCGDSIVCDNAVVRGSTLVCDNVMVRGNALVRGDAVVCDSAIVCGYADIASKDHIFYVKPVGKNAHSLTAYRSNTNEIEICCGYEVFTIESFLSRVQSWPEKERRVAEKAVELAKLHIDLSADITEGEHE